MEKEYIVSLEKNVNYDEVWHDIESSNSNCAFTPDRAVDIVNERPASLRNCHYALTDEEAALLRNDPRVLAVEIPPEQNPNIIIGRRFDQAGDFDKTTSDSGSYINWGIRRCIDIQNPYGTGSTVEGDYSYWNDGTGVDVVIQDSGIQVDHPEFNNSLGVSRVQQINWATVSGLPFTQSASFYTDTSGHGTHVAGIAAGLTYGWARNANIYSVKVDGLGTGGISVTYCFDCIKIWHQNKTANPGTGYKRPTVVNMSWGYSGFYNTVSSVYYQGVTYTDSNTTGNATYRYNTYGIKPISASAYGYNYLLPVRIASVDVDVEEMIDAGIHVCIAAGNDQYYVCNPSDTNYQNYMVTSPSGTIYFHRGMSPHSPNANIVGSIDTTVYSATEEYKATYSNQGPGVNIWAPGTSIMSACSNTNQFGAGAQPYYLNASFKQTNISGTSMASPQICGLSALYLQRNPGASVAEVKAYLEEQAGQSARLYTTGQNFDYTNTRSLMGSPNRLAYWQYAYLPQPVPFNVDKVSIST